MTVEKMAFFMLIFPCLGYLLTLLLSSKDKTKVCKERRKPHESTHLRRNSCSDGEAKTGGFTVLWVGIAHE